MLPQPPLWLILIAFVLTIGPLVFFHELGHYLVARWFGIRAQIFSIGFGREVIGWTDRIGTRWKLGWLPLGGYVKFLGDMNPASQPGDECDVAPKDRPHAFPFRPLYQRALVVLAGPLANFLLAILIFAAFFIALGAPQTNVVGTVAPGTAAERAGLEPGDRIVSIADRSTASFEDVRSVVMIRAGKTVPLHFERGGELRRIRVTLDTQKMTDPFGKTFDTGMLGISPSASAMRRLGPIEAVGEAARYTWRITVSMADGLGQIIAGERGAEDLGGPIKIAQIAGQQASLGWLPFVNLVALFSINLGFINLLPVPMLDGGHLAFYAVEAVRRRPLGPQAMEWAFRGGLALLLALVVFTTVNDLGSVGLIEGLHRLIG